MNDTRAPSPASVVMTTVAIEEGGNPEWFCISLQTTGRLMIQDQDMNIGIMGTRTQLLKMIRRMETAVNACNPETSLVDGVIGRNAEANGNTQQVPNG